MLLVTAKENYGKVVLVKMEHFSLKTDCVIWVVKAHLKLKFICVVVNMCSLVISHFSRDLIKQK